MAIIQYLDGIFLLVAVVPERQSIQIVGMLTFRGETEGQEMQREILFTIN